MKFTERMQLIKAGYTKKEIAEMEKEETKAPAASVTGPDERLDLIAQALAKLTDDVHEMHMRDDAAGGNNEPEVNIYEVLRKQLEGEDPDKNKEDK